MTSPSPVPLLVLGAPPLRAVPGAVSAWAVGVIVERLRAAPETLLVFVDGGIAATWAREALRRAKAGRCIVYRWHGTVTNARTDPDWTSEPAPRKGEHRALIAAWGLHRERVMVRRVSALAKAGHPACVLVFDVPGAKPFDRVPGEHMTLRARALGLAVEALKMKPAAA